MFVQARVPEVRLSVVPQSKSTCMCPSVELYTFSKKHLSSNPGLGASSTQLKESSSCQPLSCCVWSGEAWLTVLGVAQCQLRV